MGHTQSPIHRSYFREKRRNMKLSLCLIGAALGTSETDKIKERFNNTFNKELDQGIKYYTRKTRNKETDEIIYKHADEAIELATSLALSDDDFIESFKFCDTDDDDQATTREIKACTKRALEFIYKLLPDSGRASFSFTEFFHLSF